MSNFFCLQKLVFPQKFPTPNEGGLETTKEKGRFVGLPTTFDYYMTIRLQTQYDLYKKRIDNQLSLRIANLSRMQRFNWSYSCGPLSYILGSGPLAYLQVYPHESI